jgi:uncharacterized membrane protein
MRTPAALVALVMVTSAAVASIATAEGSRFTLIPRAVRGMNADGTVVSYGAQTDTNANIAMIYNVSRGQTTAITNPPYNTSVSGISSSGHYFAGTSSAGSPSSNQAYRFSMAGDHLLIGKMPGTAHSVAVAISGDGNIVGGHSDLNGDGITFFPFRWTPQTGRHEIGPATGLLGGRVHDVSRDGATLIGTAITNNIAGWMWRENTGMVYLPTLSTVSTEAKAVSADGSIIAGTSNLSSNPFDKFVVRWINGLISPFPLPAGMINPAVEDMSDDGNIIVGGINIPGGGGTWGMVCTPDLGLMFAHDYLAMYGVTIPAGVQIERVYAVSADGLTIGGSLRGGGGFVATVPAPASAALFAAASLFAARRRRG